MAGLDYSWVREPDYKEENFKETKENMDYIIELADYLWRIWKIESSWQNKDISVKKSLKDQQTHLL